MVAIVNCNEHSHMDSTLPFARAGYDPGLVNPYLPKVLENLGALDYEEFEEEGQMFFQITGVISSHGERLALKQVSLIGQKNGCNCCLFVCLFVCVFVFGEIYKKGPNQVYFFT